MMNTQHIAQDDLALYALQSLSPEEAETAAEHIEECEECRREVAGIRGDMALLALSVDQHPLPDGATERFMARVAASVAPAPVLAAPVAMAPVAATASQSNVVPFAAVAPKRRVWPILVPWFAVAAMIAVCISLGIENKKLSDTINAESAMVTRISANASKAQQVVDVLNAPSAQRVTLTLTKHAAEPSGHAVYLPDRGALLFQANNLQALGPGKTYELWVIPADGKAPVPAGVFKPNAEGYASVVLPQIAPGIPAKAFGVTIENEGGSLTPTMPIVLAGG